ncbi:MAG: hypothetical protein HYX54_01075 [Chloroflexi bacterium]|nr:hypothetical protein [Chloroflexota bacterium]
MTASEFAFMALGLVLGVASGAALVLVLRRRTPSPRVRVTVSHDAVPRRGATLSSDAFVTSPAEPARGGPADRRRLDRTDRPSGPPDSGGAARPLGEPDPPFGGFDGRTSVSFGNSSAAPVGIAIEPERDPALDTLRIQAAQAAARMFGADLPTATAVLERLDPRPVMRVTAPPMTVAPAAPIPAAPGAAITAAPIAPTPIPAAPYMHAAFMPAPFMAAPSMAEYERAREVILEPIDDTPALTRILRGDHHALFSVAAKLAGPDATQLRAWEVAVRAVTDGIVTATIAEGYLDFPVGNPFWDTFTVEQCRAIAGALAAAGYRFDGVDSWADGRSPNYRDLTIAVAGAGLEPRRIRAWPTQEEIDELYLEVSAASDEYVATRVPMLSLAALQDLVGVGGLERSRIWDDWDRVRAVLTTRITSG